MCVQKLAKLCQAFLTGAMSDFRARDMSLRNRATSHQFPEEEPDLREGLPAPHGPREIVAVSVEAFGGAVDAGGLGLACNRVLW